MAKIIRSKDDLPSWFSLDKYEVCKDFTAAEWYLNLWLRKEPWCYFVSEKGSHHLDKMIIDSALAHLRESPIHRAKPKPLKTPIRPLKFSDLAERVLNDRHDANALNRWNAVMGFDGAESRELRESVGVIDSPFESLYPIVVDFSASDQELLNLFKGWLKNTRSEVDVQSQNRLRQKYEKWAGFKLLPYIDLIIWEREKGVRIPQEVMTAILLPAIDSPGNTRIRDTVGPLAEQLMQDLSGLEAQALAEEGEGPTH